MSDSGDIEERFRVACAAYLAAAEQYDRDYAARHDAEVALCASERAADRARDELLQVVRERDLQAQLGAGETVVYPSRRASEAQAAWLALVARAGGPVTTEVTMPEDTDYWKRHNGICPECGISWREPSPGCPHLMANWHPLH